MKKYEKWIETNTHLLTNQLAVVVGGTGSIGKEVVDILLHLKAKVIIAARNIAKAEALKKQMLLKYPNAYIYVEYLDISNLQSIDDFQLAIDAKYQKIDIFINNSGIYHQNSSLSKDGYEIHFATNTLGNYYLSKKIIFDLKYHSKMVFVSSLASEFFDINFSDIQSLHTKSKMKIYSRSKKMMTMNVLSLKNELKAHSIDVNIVHPGVCATDLFSSGHSKLFMMIVHPLMKLIFHSPKKAALSIVKGIFASTEVDEWIGPRGIFHVSGYPKISKISKKNCDTTVIQKVENIMRDMVLAHNQKNN